MLPDNVLSTTPQWAPYLVPNAVQRPHDLVAYELGGVGLNDTSQGLRVKVWTAQVDDEGNVVLAAEGAEPTVLITATGLSSIALAFDQNMNPALAYEFESGAPPRLYWYDTVIPGYTKLALPAGSFDVRIALDEHRRGQQGASDIILTYIRGGKLYSRQQRDRFLTEYELRDGLTGYRLKRFGMNRKFRMQWELVPGELPDEPLPPTCVLTIEPEADAIEAGKSASIAVNIQRGGSFIDAVAISSSGQPEGVTLTGGSISEGEHALQVDVEVHEDTEAGEYPIDIVGTALGVTIEPAQYLLTVTQPEPDPEPEPEPEPEPDPELNEYQFPHLPSTWSLLVIAYTLEAFESLPQTWTELDIE